jgi:DNA-directed RNA polymerase subunit RPC12/RpoP
MARYHCKHCGKTVERASKKRWLRSYCVLSGIVCRLWRVTWPPRG